MFKWVGPLFCVTIGLWVSTWDCSEHIADRIYWPCWVNIGNLRTTKYLANDFVRAVFFSRVVPWACHTKLGAVISGITSFLSVVTRQYPWFSIILSSVILFLSSGLYDGNSASTESINYTFRVGGIKWRTLCGDIFMEGSLFDCLVCQLVCSDLLDLSSWCEPGSVTLSCSPRGGTNSF